MGKNNLSIIDEELTTFFGEDGLSLLLIYKKLQKSQNHKYLDSLIVDLYDIYSQLSNEFKNYSIDDFVTDIIAVLNCQNKDIEEICATDITTLKKEWQTINKEKTIFNLVDCEDKYVYKVLIFDGFISQQEIQAQINNIKNEWHENDNGNYLTEYVLERLQQCYTFSIIGPKPNLEI